jgi:hypothetical protein
VGYAIRIPANKNLELEIEDILFRSPGRPSRKPLQSGESLAAAGETRALLLAPAGRESLDAADVRGDAPGGSGRYPCRQADSRSADGGNGAMPQARADGCLKGGPEWRGSCQFEAGKSSRGQTSNGRGMRQNYFRAPMVLGCKVGSTKMEIPAWVRVGWRRKTRR